MMTAFLAISTAAVCGYFANLDGSINTTEAIIILGMAVWSGMCGYGIDREFNKDD